MYQKRKFLITCTALLGLSILSGCGTQEALKYNNSIASANAELNKVGVAFGETIEPALSGGAEEMDRCREAYEQCISVAEKVKSDCGDLKVPDSDAARKLQSIHQEYLQGQVDMCRNDFAEVVELLENDEQSIAEKATQIDEILNRVATKEDATLIPLQSAQLR